MTPEQREGDFGNDLSSERARGALGGECRVDTKGDRRTEMNSDDNGFQGKDAVSLGEAGDQSGGWRLSPVLQSCTLRPPLAPVLIRPSISSLSL